MEVKPPYTQAEERLTLPYGTDVYDLDVSPNGALASVIETDSAGRNKVVLYDVAALREKRAVSRVVKDFGYSGAAAFTFSPDGRKLYGSSYFTGASNLFRLDVESNEMEVITNTETGLFWPRKLADGRLLAFEYTAQGFYPVWVEEGKALEDVTAVRYLGQEVVEKYPVVKSWKMPPPESVDVAKLTEKAGEFRPFRRMRPSSIYPIVQGYQNSVAYGARMDLTDGLGLSEMHMTASYSPDSRLASNERLHLGLELKSMEWRVKAYWNGADFYDLFGPTRTSRKGFAGLVGKRKFLRYSSSRSLEWDTSLAGYAGLDRLPEFQNVFTTFDRFLVGRTQLNYKRVVKTLGAVDDEKGTKWRLVGQTNLVNGVLFPRFYGQWDQGFLTPLRNSPVWLRTTAGKSFGDRQSPFASYYFGGFGNNWVDHQEISRYREYYAFPGVRLNEIGATDYSKTTVEWNLPPKRFADFGTTSLYCNWARLSLFTGMLAGNLARPGERQLFGNVGAQLDVKLVLASYLNATFSVGMAAAQDRTGRRTSELMVSLKLQ